MFEVAGLAPNLLVFLLVLWATTGLTFIHLGVLAYRGVRRGRRIAVGAPEPAVPEGPPPTITFVVPVYNDGTTVGPTIESILRQSARPDRILVVNDGSTDGTYEVLEGFRGRGVDVIHLPANVGKTRALDHALQHVDTELVAITDADSIVHVDYVREMLETFRDPELAAAAGAVESIPHTWVTAARHIEYMLTVKIDRDAEHTMKALVVLPGVSTTYRTRVLRELGFEFDTIAEDFDLTFRLQRAGYKIAMNMRAKVYTSDPPTLSAYYRQLVRWYTDFFLVIKKHRKVLGKKVFGTVEVPMLVLNATLSSFLFFALPIYMAFFAPEQLPMFFLTATVVDVALVIIAWRTYRRNDVFWAVLSRIPTRFVSRFAYLLAMTRVAVGRPGLAWDKLERRGTDAFLSASAPPPAVAVALAEAPLAIREESSAGRLTRRVAIGLLLVASFVAPLVSIPFAIALIALGLLLLAFRAIAGAYAAAAGHAARVAWLGLAQIAVIVSGSIALRILPIEVGEAWRIAILAFAAQGVFLVVSWPWRLGTSPTWLGLAGHATALASTGLLIAQGLSPFVIAGYGASFLLLGVGTTMQAPSAKRALDTLAAVPEPEPNTPR